MENQSSQICELYEQGENIKILAKKFGVSPSTIWRLLRKHSVMVRGRLKRISPARTLSREKAYILGCVGLGDGHITSSSPYSIALRATDVEFVEEFARCVKKVFGLDCSFANYKPRRGAIESKKPQVDARLYSKEAWSDILRYGELGFFRHHTGRVPQEIFKADLDIKASYLRALFDSQGSVPNFRRGRRVEIGKSNREAIEGIGMLLADFGIKFKVYAGKTCRTLSIQDKESIEKFAKKIGFNIERKRDNLKRILLPHPTRSLIIDSLIPTMLELKRQGFGSRRIASALGISRSAVKCRLKNIREEIHGAQPDRAVGAGALRNGVEMRGVRKS